MRLGGTIYCRRCDFPLTCRIQRVTQTPGDRSGRGSKGGRALTRRYRIAGKTNSEKEFALAHVHPKRIADVMQPLQQYVLLLGQITRKLVLREVIQDVIRRFRTVRIDRDGMLCLFARASGIGSQQRIPEIAVCGGEIRRARDDVLEGGAGYAGVEKRGCRHRRFPLDV